MGTVKGMLKKPVEKGEIWACCVFWLCGIEYPFRVSTAGRL